MSLAARCPACGTAFRVVPDQLRVSDGWVRCGRCQEVFNANKTLFDLRSVAVATTASSSLPAAAPGSSSVPTPMPTARSAPGPRSSAVPSITVGVGVAAPLAPTHVDLSSAGWNDPGPAPRVPLDVDALHASLFGALPVEPSAPAGNAAASPADATPPQREAEAGALEVSVPASQGLVDLAEPLRDAAADSEARASTSAAPDDAATEARQVEDAVPSPLPSDEASVAVVDDAATLPTSSAVIPPPSTNTLAPVTSAATEDGPVAGGPSRDRHDHGEPLQPGTSVADDASSPPATVDEPELASTATSSLPAESAADALEPNVAGTDATAVSPEPQAQAPSFVRKAERAARWRSPEMRVLLFVATLALSAAAVLQAVSGFHDAIVERWPASRAAVQALCSVSGCQLQAPRRLESLSVEGSSLSAIDGGERVRLSLLLRNRARSDRLLPAIELTLSDAQGAMLARRVFTAAELGASVPTIGGGAELALQAVLDVGGAPVAGYALDLFYP